MNNNNRRRRNRNRGISNTYRIIIAILILFLLVGGAVYAYQRVAKPGNVIADELTDVDLAAMDESLSVDLNDLLADAFSHFSMEFLDSSMPNKAKERTAASGFSDAVSFPFTSHSESEERSSAIYEELKEEILRNPIMGDMTARGLADIKLSSDKTISSLNPWITEFISKTDESIRIPNSDDYRGQRGMEIWLTRRYDDEAIYVSEEYREYANMICLLLDRLVEQGVYSWTSSKNFCLNYTAEAPYTRVELSNYQEDKPALILAYVHKNGQVEFQIGFNLLDKRFETFKEGQIPQEEVPETSPVPEEGTVPTPTTTPEEGTVPTPTTTPKEGTIPTKPTRGTITPTKPSGSDPGGEGTIPTPDPKPTPSPTEPSGGDDGKGHKDPAVAPVNRGNQQQGGGDNRKSDGSGTYQPIDPATESRAGNASDNGHGLSDPKTVTPITPEPEGPAEGAKKPTVATQESKMNYETDSQNQNTSWKDSSTGQVINHIQPETKVENGISQTQAHQPNQSSAAGDGQQMAEPPID